MMKRTVALAVLLVFIVTILPACATTPTRQGAGIGATAGAILGAIIGHQQGRGAEGAGIGGAAGGLLGALIGDFVDERRERQAQQQQQSTQPAQW